MCLCIRDGALFLLLVSAVADTAASPRLLLPAETVPRPRAGFCKGGGEGHGGVFHPNIPFPDLEPAWMLPLQKSS